MALNILKKIFTTFFLSFLILNLSNVTFAATQEISAEGEYRLGDRDSRETAKMAALADAKRKIIEQVGVYVESYSEMNNFNLTQDQIRTTANAMIKVKHEEVHYYENGTICRAFVVASIDTENIGKYIDNPNSPPASNNTDGKNLKLLGIEEYNGHYYKVFNDGMTWKDAKKTCEDMGGHLVTITSIIEQEVVKNLVVANGVKGFYWMGGFMVTKNNFKWITGEKFSYSNWAENQPDNYGGVENVATMWHGSGIDGLWNDAYEIGRNNNNYIDLPFYNIENSGFICEWESYDDMKI